MQTAQTDGRQIDDGEQPRARKVWHKPKLVMAPIAGATGNHGSSAGDTPFGFLQNPS